MTVINCKLTRCLRNLNGTCKRIRVWMKDGKCVNFRPRMREGFNEVTHVICSSFTCVFNKLGVCVKTAIYVTEKGCEPKEGT